VSDVSAGGGGGGVKRGSVDGAARRGTVLVAEDDLFLRPRIQGDLERAGWAVSFAPSVARFREALAAPPDVILVNLASRGMAFRALLDEARAAAPDVPVVGYGPHVDETLFAAGLAAGCRMVVPNGAVAKSSPAVVERALADGDRRA
jgi:CheY-like chemotaxis protein